MVGGGIGFAFTSMYELLAYCASPQKRVENNTILDMRQEKRREIVLGLVKITTITSFLVGEKVLNL